MKICCRFKTRDQIDKSESEKAEYIMNYFPITGDTIPVTFNNAETGFEHRSEKYKVEFRILLDTEYLQEYFSKHKPHFICKLIPLIPDANLTYSEIFLIGYRCLEGEERIKLIKDNSFLIRRFQETKTDNISYIERPVINDIIEYKMNYFSIDSANPSNTQFEIVLGEKNFAGGLAIYPPKP